MSLLNGQNVCDTVAFRIAGRLPANGTGAGSIIECANQALGLISSAASWDWDQTTGTVSLSNDTAILTGADIGKEFAFFNANGTRIERARQSDAFSASTGYLNVASSGTSALYNTFRLAVDSGGFTYNPFVVFSPALGLSGSIYVNGTWHNVPPVLTYSSSPTVRWIATAMDQLLVDLTEAIVKRVTGLAGWDVMYADCVKRIGEFRVTYSSQRENTGPDAESDISAKEKSTGRD
jgi:hypothetical protein